MDSLWIHIERHDRSFPYHKIDFSCSRANFVTSPNDLNYVVKATRFLNAIILQQSKEIYSRYNEKSKT